MEACWRRDLRNSPTSTVSSSIMSGPNTAAQEGMVSSSELSCSGVWGVGGGGWVRVCIVRADKPKHRGPSILHSLTSNCAQRQGRTG